jgi:predicted kinase
MATLHLMIGLPCSGKTTRAKELEIELKALRLTPDEWHRHLFGQDATHPEHDNRHNKIEELQWRVAASTLALGKDVILDFGMWQLSERQDFRKRAAAIGATTVIHLLDVPHDELFARLEARNKEAEDKVTYIPPSMLQEWIPYFQVPDEAELALNGT